MGGVFALDEHWKFSRFIGQGAPLHKYSPCAFSCVGSVWFNIQGIG